MKVPVKAYLKGNFESRIIFFLFCPLGPSGGEVPHLLAVVSDRGQDSTEGLEAHGNVQQMSGEEKVVEVSEDGHGGVPDQIQEVLREKETKETYINVFMMQGGNIKSWDKYTFK